MTAVEGDKNQPGGKPIWQTWVLSLFPDVFPGPLGVSLAGKALENGLWRLHARDIRDYATDRHRSVDDTVFGGGPGMILRPDIVAAAIDDARMAAKSEFGAERLDEAVPVVYLSPRGTPLRQSKVEDLASRRGLILLCGRFEGVDQRVLDARQVEEISLGDFVLSGGEPAALALIDAVVRLLPGVIGDAAALSEESFSNGLLEYPQYTRPRDWQGRVVPEVLLSGHHAHIREWRRQQAETLTKIRRPDLWQAHETGE